MTGPTTIPTITADGFAQRMAALIPRGWASDAAKQPGGNLYALLYSLGSQLNFLITELQYALAAQRIQTETSPELDEASQDYFGNALPRPPGMSDANFAALIMSNLLQKGATRQAVSDAVYKLTGIVPRIVEPWNPGDTGCRDSLLSYRDIDTAANPLENTNPGARYQGFISTIAPPVMGLGLNPLLTRDGAGFRDANEYRISIAVISGVQELYNAINKVKVEGTVVWVKIIQGGSGGNDWDSGLTWDNGISMWG
jgi:hypothetical protein